MPVSLPLKLPVRSCKTHVGLGAWQHTSAHLTREQLLHLPLPLLEQVNTDYMAAIKERDQNEFTST